ncbi:hypothetical protein PIB30_090205 [Stylosanthes scabra]|uniref:Uncharacterized protein n=1 Tax=Stylosanthes scabra TaxID=79078 RepID=A0ABU6XVC6_9FABA|nr:hypothetical protein [Stylosanthes scabra]
MEEHAYAFYNKPNPRLSNSITLRRGTFTSSFLRICVEVHAYAWEANKLTFHSHVYTISNVTFTSPSLIHPRIGIEDPRICVEGTLAASNHTKPTPESFKLDSKLRKTHAYAWKALWQQATTLNPRQSHSSVTPNFARTTHRRGSPRICVESSQVTFEAHVWKSSNVTLPC